MHQNSLLHMLALHLHLLSVFFGFRPKNVFLTILSDATKMPLLHRLDAVRHNDAEAIPERCILFVSKAMPFHGWTWMLIFGQYARLAVVTGANKGVGLEVCRQLALQGVTVILTARDEKRGKDATETLRRESQLPNIIFHQLDVRDDDGVTSLAWYIKNRYGKLDILVSCSLLLFSY